MLKLHKIIGRPDKIHLLEEGMSMALRYFHTLEDWEDQKVHVSKLEAKNVECLDGKTVIKLDTFDCKCHRILRNKIEFMGQCYKKGNCADGKSYSLTGNTLTLPVPCPDSCITACGSMSSGTTIPACFVMLCLPDFEVTCDAVTGSWIYDKYPEVVRNYAMRYVRAILDGKDFEFDEGNDLIVLRGEL